MTPAGTLTTLVAFRNSNGGRPVAGLIQGTDGAFYGTTVEGGTYNKGTIFRVTAAGAFTTLKALNFDEEVFAPRAALVQGSDGNFYGTATGGIHNAGAIFRLTSAGVMSVVYLFSGSGGAYPNSELMQSNDGSFYGTTGDERTPQGGVIYRVTQSGTRTNSAEFSASERVRGFNPGGGLVKGPDGNYYGTNEKGGAGGSGTVFRLTPSGVFTTLAAFDGLSSANPHGTPIFGADGKLYGSAGQMSLWRLALPGSGTPQAVTMAADQLGGRQATLRGTINAQGQGFAEAFFQYGIDPGLVGALEVDALTAASGSLNTPVSLTVSDLLPGTLYYYRAVARLGTSQTGSISTFKTLTRLQQWRQDYFGTSANAGAAADTEDPDGDGLSNLMEFAMGTSPGQGSLSTQKLVHAPNQAGITYTRSKAAVADGVKFTAQWSNSLSPAAWSSVGISTFVFGDSGSEQQVQSVLNAPGARRYFRLKVESP